MNRAHREFADHEDGVNRAEPLHQCVGDKAFRFLPNFDDLFAAVFCGKQTHAVKVVDLSALFIGGFKEIVLFLRNGDIAEADSDAAAGGVFVAESPYAVRNSACDRGAVVLPEDSGR